MGESATTIYLIRHGRTTLNAQGRFRGRQDPPLDAVGRDQASSAAKLLSDIRLAAVYSSPLTRAVQTAETVGASCELDVVIEPELIDLDYGMWEGLTEEEALGAEDVAPIRRHHVSEAEGAAAAGPVEPSESPDGT